MLDEVTEQTSFRRLPWQPDAGRLYQVTGQATAYADALEARLVKSETELAEHKAALVLAKAECARQVAATKSELADVAGASAAELQRLNEEFGTYKAEAEGEIAALKAQADDIPAIRAALQQERIETRELLSKLRSSLGMRRNEAVALSDTAQRAAFALESEVEEVSVMLRKAGG